MCKRPTEVMSDRNIENRRPNTNSRSCTYHPMDTYFECKKGYATNILDNWYHYVQSSSIVMCLASKSIQNRLMRSQPSMVVSAFLTMPHRSAHWNGNKWLKKKKWREKYFNYYLHKKSLKCIIYLPKVAINHWANKFKDCTFLLLLFFGLEE